MDKKTISILGLGWLGLPLAKSLAAKGFFVKGSVTSEEKAFELICYNFDLSVLTLYPDRVSLSNESFFDTDLLIVNIPPRRANNIETIYPAQVGQLIPYIEKHQIGKVIFVSSTSVYPEVNREVSENDHLLPDKPSGIACLDAEKVLMERFPYNVTSIRFGGLIGPGRYPHRFMRPGAVNGNGNQPVNLIHLHDCIGIIEHVIENKLWGETINGCCPLHPTREAFYRKAAQLAGVEPPIFDNNESLDFKIVSTRKIENMGYRFKFKSPVDALPNFVPKR
jgi:nucleoside-diphosphate-sugar epimerase